MTKLDAGLMTSLPASDPGSAAVWGSKRINPRPQSCLCLTWSGYCFKRRRRRRRSNTNHKTIEQNNIVRDTKNFNTENFLIELSENLSIINNNCTVDEQFERFLDIFNITLSKHAPLRRKSRKEKKLNSKPWITKAILISSKTKNKLYIANLKESANDVQLYKTYCNKLTHVKEQAKRKYYQGLILASKHNMKLLWKTINDIAK